MPDDRRRLPAPRCVRRLDRFRMKVPEIRCVVRILRRQPLAVLGRPTDFVEERRRNSRLFAAEHAEPDGQGSREVLACKTPVRWDVPKTFVRKIVGEPEVDVADQATLIRDDEVPAGTENARELTKRPLDIREVHQSDGADDEIDRLILQW